MINPEIYNKLLKEDIEFLKQDANSRIRLLEAALHFACLGVDNGELRPSDCIGHVMDQDLLGGSFPLRKGICGVYWRLYL